jgi:hypothetical protein
MDKLNFSFCTRAYLDDDCKASSICEGCSDPPTRLKVDHPKHYTQHPLGIECIDVVESMSFNLGNAIKYLWRASEKGNYIEDLEKAIWYIQREIQRTKKKVIK